MEHQLPPSAPGSLAETAGGIAARLQTAGFEAFWVGGCVRDSLLGRVPGDYDIATSARPEEMEKLFSRTIPVGRKFGVIIVVEAGHQFEVATFRAEAEYLDGRRPEKVTFAEPKADAQRRDFTVNGLFFDPVQKKVHDWVGGEQDLRRKLIRTIGAPEERFGEDHLRMLRAVRFATQLDFEIDPATFAALQLLAPKILGISAERIREELIRIFAPPHAGRGLELLRASGLLPHVLPELEPTIHCEQSPDHHPEGSVFNHIALMLSQLPTEADPSLPWCALLHDIAKPVTATRDENNGLIHFYGHEREGAVMAETILERLRFPKKQIKEICEVVRYHMQFKDAPEMRKSTLRRMLMRPTFPLELALHRLDCLGSRGKLDIYDFLVAQAEILKNQPHIIPPLLDGHDLIELGVRPGPEMGKLLADLREKQLRDEIQNAEEARQWIWENEASE
jgi:poly(A) polymerase